MTVAQAVQLLSANQIEALIGCIPAGSPAPAAEQDLLGLLGTIDGMSLDTSTTGDLDGSVRDIGTDVVDGDQDGACRSLGNLSTTIADYLRRGKLGVAQAAALGGAVTDIHRLLGC